MGRPKTHGHSSIDGKKGTTGTYNTWRMMLQRCEDPKHISYINYGKRGIEVCKRWHDFSIFLSDMGIRPEGKTLDRIDPNNGYYLENCRWVTPSEQQSNRSDTKFLTVDGVTLSLPQWCRKLSVNRYKVHSRIKRGWSLEKAILTPMRKYSKSN